MKPSRVAPLLLAIAALAPRPAPGAATGTSPADFVKRSSERSARRNQELFAEIRERRPCAAPGPRAEARCQSLLHLSSGSAGAGLEAWELAFSDGTRRVVIPMKGPDARGFLGYVGTDGKDSDPLLPRARKIEVGARGGRAIWHPRGTDTGHPLEIREARRIPAARAIRTASQPAELTPCCWAASLGKLFENAEIARFPGTWTDVPADYLPAR